MASLRVRMATSYVLVTAAAVVVVEATMLALLLSRSAGTTAEDVVQRQASKDAKTFSAIVSKIYYGKSDLTHDEALAAAAKSAPPGTVLAGQAKVDGVSGGPRKDGRPAKGFEALVQLDGSIIASTDPDFGPPPGRQLPITLPKTVSGADTGRVDGIDVVWAVAPVVLLPDFASGAAEGAKPAEPRASPKSHTQPDSAPSGKDLLSGKRFKGDVPGTSTIIGAIVFLVPKGRVTSSALASWQPLLASGGIVLLLVLPVGVVFGLLSTRRLIRRVHRLAGMTANVAGGDFGSRVAVAGGDEIGRLEDSVNRMAEQLGAALESERMLAGAGARQAERARIARELHDSISQDLFSLNLLAGGLRRALPEGDELRTQAAAMERTASRTMREMQAMLLELRPVVLEDAGLVPALEELCRAYETRLGIQVNAALADVRLDPPAEHAVLRVTQEALGNAIKHGDPSTIEVRLANGAGADGNDITLEVRDDGCGFDPARVRDRHGMGLGLMRERVTELGGVLEVSSGPGEGTTVRVRLPAGVRP